MKNVTPALFALLLSACASQPEDIPAASVSTLQYQDYSCKQVALELDRVSRKANELYYRLDKKAGNDAAQMGIGLVLFWPTLFFLEGGDGPEAAEYARLRGELDALESVSIRKKCGIAFPDPQPARKKDESETRKGFNE